MQLLGNASAFIVQLVRILVFGVAQRFYRAQDIGDIHATSTSRGANALQNVCVYSHISPAYTPTAAAATVLNVAMSTTRGIMLVAIIPATVMPAAKPAHTALLPLS
jgi:hypothetical protein